MQNEQQMKQILSDVASLREDVIDIKRVINGLKINEQRFIKANNSIPPGIATKVSYDSNGLITNGTKLESSDIPEITIDHINGLRRLLNEKISNSEFERLRIESSNNGLKKGNIVGSGIKVNFDEHGLIVSISDLLESDIPSIPISKVTGLDDVLKLLESHHKDDTSQIDDISVIPGTYCKITYDKHGRVVSGSDLTVNDIPIDIITRINWIETMLPNLVTADVVSTWIDEIKKKVDSNHPITPGTYTKVTVDHNGLVTKGENISIRDLPNITIEDIIDLDRTLKQKANTVDLIDLNNTVSSMLSSLSKIGDVTALRNELKKKASIEEVQSVDKEVKSIRTLVNTLSEKIPNDTILDQLNQIQFELSNLSGRISILEQHLDIPKDI